MMPVSSATPWLIICVPSACCVVPSATCCEARATSCVACAAWSAACCSCTRASFSRSAVPAVRASVVFSWSTIEANATPSASSSDFGRTITVRLPRAISAAAVAISLR